MENCLEVIVLGLNFKYIGELAGKCYYKIEKQRREWTIRISMKLLDYFQL